MAFDPISKTAYARGEQVDLFLKHKFFVSYNYCHTRTRIIVEQSLGKVKGRFKILQTSTRVPLEKIPTIILACFVLHNICIDLKQPEPDDIDDKTDKDADMEEIDPETENPNVNQTRQYLVNNYFLNYDKNKYKKSTQ